VQRRQVATHHDGRRDEHEVLDDVLTLHREFEGRPRETDLGKNKKGQEGPRHLEKQQEHSDSHQRSPKQTDPDRHLPPAQHWKENVRRQPVYRSFDQVIGGACVEGFQ
jgi:hypothetical protein